MGCVYLATNTVNGKQYVGMTRRTFKQRKLEHKREAKCGEGYLFHAAIRKHGFSAFEWGILLESDDVLQLLATEIESICRLGTMHNGYNLCGGGEGGAYLPTERIKQLSAGLSLRWQDDEWRKTFGEKMSAQWSDEKYRETTSAAISAARIGKGRSVVAGGVQYESTFVAARALSLPEATVRNRIELNTPRWTDWYWAEEVSCTKKIAISERRRKLATEVGRRLHPNIFIEGSIFPSFPIASRQLGLNIGAVYSRVNSKNPCFRRWHTIPNHNDPECDAVEECWALMQWAKACPDHPDVPEWLRPKHGAAPEWAKRAAA